jgi:hypothetical protein
MALATSDERQKVLAMEYVSPKQIFALLSLAVIIIGIVMGMRRYALATRGVICDARVAAWRVKKAFGEPNEYFAEVAYVDWQGRSRQVELDYLFSEQEFAIGEHLKIVYDRDRPARPHRYAITSMILQPLVIIVFGVVGLGMVVRSYIVS